MEKQFRTIINPSASGGYTLTQRLLITDDEGNVTTVPNREIQHDTHRNALECAMNFEEAHTKVED